MSELKPCPFCGGEAEIERIGTPRASMIIACTDCGARLESGETFISEHSAWNTRAALSQPIILGVPNTEDETCRHCGHVTKAGEHHSHPCAADSGHPDDVISQPSVGVEEVYETAIVAFRNGTKGTLDHRLRLRLRLAIKAILAKYNVTVKG